VKKHYRIIIYFVGCLNICSVAEQLAEKPAIKPTEPKGHGPQGPQANIIVCFVATHDATFWCPFQLSLITLVWRKR
jgi:hypothetical protein